MELLNFCKGKKVLVTGHTGFKGTWLCKILLNSGAEVTGYALEPKIEPCFFMLAGIEKLMRSVIGDIRDLNKLKSVFEEVQPEIVIHMAAQPIVRDSYREPVYTYETNVMGTVNVLECVRLNPCVKSFLNVTTDKVYENKERDLGYRENDPLDGFDPYSNSKSCSELVTHSYRRSFFDDGHCSISCARAGNVIGGGDFSNDRIIPDCIRAAKKGEVIIVRNPDSIRPYQHVLEPLFAYLMIAKAQYEDVGYSGWYNVGPDECDCVTTRKLVDSFSNCWSGVKWESKPEKNAPHEAGLLKLDCSKLKSVFDWKPIWKVDTAISKVCEWYRVWVDGGSIPLIMDDQIREYYEEFSK